MSTVLLLCTSTAMTDDDAIGCYGDSSIDCDMSSVINSSTSRG